MSDDNSSSDDELDLVLGHLFDSGNDDSSDDSSSDEYESSTEEPLGAQPMFQGPQHLASDPRYLSSHFHNSAKATFDFKDLRRQSMVIFIC